MNAEYLLILFLTVALVYSLKAFRFYFLLVGEGISILKYLRVFARTTFVNIALPFKCGELYRFYAFGRLTKNYAKGFSIVLLDRFIDTVSLLCIFAVLHILGKFELGRIFSANVEVENFVVPWAMKRARVMALAAGTVFELTAENLTAGDKKNLGEKIYRGFSVRTEEGFGQIRLWDSRGFTLEKTAAEEIQTPTKFSGETVELAKKILLNRLLAQVRVEAIEDAQDLRRQLKRGNFTHFFSRLDGILANAGRENVRAKFQERLAAEIRTGTLFDDHLKNIRMTNGQSFFDAFSGHAELPYESRDLEKNFAAVKEALGIAALNFDDEIYFEYLQKYFRFARKVAAEAKGGEDE